MITGKNKQRLCFAEKAIQNFKDQEYPNKKLIIINHHVSKVTKNDEANIAEFIIPKTTLGELRNIALQMVPIDACWTIWDDDDYRTHDYLQILYDEMSRTNSDVVLFTSRIECNYLTKFVWKVELKRGFVTVLAKQDLRIKYMPLDSMEDTELIRDFEKLKKKIWVWSNPDPQIYVRLVHGKNTSLYVQKNKDTIRESDRNSILIESDVDKELQEKVSHFISTYFKGCWEN